MGRWPRHAVQLGLLGVLAVACGEEEIPERPEVCDARIACAVALGESTEADEQARYGVDGSCWGEDAETAETCSRECSDFIRDARDNQPTVEECWGNVGVDTAALFDELGTTWAVTEATEACFASFQDPKSAPQAEVSGSESPFFNITFDIRAPKEEGDFFTRECEVDLDRAVYCDRPPEWTDLDGAFAEDFQTFTLRFYEPDEDGKLTPEEDPEACVATFTPAASATTTP